MDATTLNYVAAGAASLASIAGVAAFVKSRRAVPDAVEEANDQEAPRALWRRAVGPIAVHLRPTNADELELLTTRLLTAGRRSREAVDRFCEERVIALLGGMIGALLWASVIGGTAGALLALVSLVLGIAGPSKVIAGRAQARRDAIAGALPGAIDLLTTCVDAGLSLEQALARVAREIEPSSETLSAELMVTVRELEAGVALADGLRRLSRRVGLDELSALCGVIGQAHGLGAPVGHTLREFAESSRRSRMSMLEERAGKLAAQLTLPLATCLLPAAMLIIIGPAVLQLVRALH